MFHCRYQSLQFLWLRADALRAQVGMPRYGTIQQCLLLAMSRICHSQTLETALRLPRRDIKDEICFLDAFSRFCAAVNAAVLTRAVAHAAHLSAERGKETGKRYQSAFKVTN